jgi:hypothetical protein
MSKLLKAMNREVESPIDPTAWLFLGFFAAFLAVTMSCFLLVAVREVRRTEFALQNWAQHTGKIETIERRRSKFGGYHILSGSYEWRNILHRFNTPKIDRMEWWRITGRFFNVGDIVAIYVDPSAPQNAIVEPSLQLGTHQRNVRESQLLATIAAVAAVSCFSMFWFSKRRKKASGSVHARYFP